MVATSGIFILACILLAALAAVVWGPAILSWPGRALRAVFGLPGRLLSRAEDWVTTRRARRLALRQAELDLAQRELDLFERSKRIPPE